MTGYSGQAIPVKTHIERYDCVSLSNSRFFNTPHRGKRQFRSLLAYPI
jgi:hypothetical protein